jgi:catalase
VDGGFTSYAERIDAKKIRDRSKSFMDHFSQARLFFNSQSQPEKNHIISALRFELGKVETPSVRERMLYILSQVDKTLADEVAFGLGMAVPETVEKPVNQGAPADARSGRYEPTRKESSVAKSEALSMANTIKSSIKTRKIAFLVANGFDASSVNTMKTNLEKAGAMVELIAPRLGALQGNDKSKVEIKKSFLTDASVLYDAVYIPGGSNSVALLSDEADAIHFINEAYKHCKAIAADEEAKPVLESTYFSKNIFKETKNKTAVTNGVLIGDSVGKLAKSFIDAIAQHRFWEREKIRQASAAA